MVINVIGAGLAGCEACYYLAKKGYNVRLYEMRPKKMTPAHKTDKFAELVCSNSLRSDSLENACGILKKEMEMLDSLIIKAARLNKVEAGGALAVDREGYSQYVTNIIKGMPNIEIVNEEIKKIDTTIPTIIATGPLTSEPFAETIAKITGADKLYFYDAAAPIVTKESINMDIAFFRRPLCTRKRKGRNSRRLERKNKECFRRKLY